MIDLWKHRELIWQFTLRNVELRHKGSHLGLIWSFVNPLLLLGLYVFVFGYIFSGTFDVLPNETRTEYGLGIFFGLVLFHFISEVLASSSGIIVSNPNFVKKVVFPLEILPAASVLGAAFHLLIGLGLLLAGVVILGPGVHLSATWLPVILFPLVLLMLGVSWFFSALGVFFRDTSQVMPLLVTALMFASAVFYSPHKIPEPAWAWMRFNPLLLAIDLARNAGLWARPINFYHLAYLYGVSLAVCYLGHLTFRKMKPAFADVL